MTSKKSLGVLVASAIVPLQLPAASAVEWCQQTSLRNLGFSDHPGLGASVAIDEDANVGIALAATTGSAQIIRFNGSEWELGQLLSPSTSGSSVSISGTVAVVGAKDDNCGAVEGCGSAYFFRYNGTSWVQEQKICASDAASGDGFGAAVGISGNVAVIGAPGDDCAAGGAVGPRTSFVTAGLLGSRNKKPRNPPPL